MNETFICEACGRDGPIRHLHHRETMPGQYCPLCADLETCGACGEELSSSQLSWQPDVRNYICQNCLPDYEEVAGYIKPLTGIQTKVVPLVGSETIKKAS
jgi:hypothetical protein